MAESGGSSGSGSDGSDKLSSSDVRDIVKDTVSLGPLSRLKDYVDELVTIAKRLGPLVDDIVTFFRNPKRAVQGILLGSLVGILTTISLETIATFKLVLGFPVPAKRWVCGRPEGCLDNVGIVDVADLLFDTVVGATQEATVMVATSLSGLFQTVAVPAGPAAPVVVTLLWAATTMAAIYGFWYGGQLLLLISPYP